jgi:hypothetical protein
MSPSPVTDLSTYFASDVGKAEKRPAIAIGE